MHSQNFQILKLSIRFKSLFSLNCIRIIYWIYNLKHSFEVISNDWHCSIQQNTVFGIILFLISIFHCCIFSVVWTACERRERWMGRRETGLAFYFIFSFLPFQKKRNSESSRSAFLCNLEAVLFGQSFCYQTYPFKTLFQIRQFLIPFVILLCI